MSRRLSITLCVTGAAVVVLLVSLLVYHSTISPARTVGTDGLTLKVGKATIVIPADAVPEGTEVTATLAEVKAPQSVSGFEQFKVLSRPLSIHFTGGLQPRKPLRVSFPVGNGQRDEGYALLLDGKGESADLVEAGYDAKTKSITGTVPHLSFIWPISVDFNALGKTVSDVVLQSTGIESARPDCVDKPATVNGVKYSAISPAQLWVCVKNEGGALVVESSPNSALAFKTSSTQTVAGKKQVTGVDLATAFAVAAADRIERLNGNQAITAPGSTAKFNYSGTPPNFQLKYSQLPAMQLMSILANTIDVVAKDLDGKVFERMGELKCMADIVPPGLDAGKGLSAPVVAGISKAFFSCVGPVLGDLPGPQRVALTMISAVPQAFTGTFLGLLNEVTGAGRFAVDIDAEGTSKVPVIVDYTHGDSFDGIAIRRAGDVAKLVGSPQDFKQFIENELGRQQQADDSFCGTRGGTVTVQKIASSGYAAGAINSDCGGGYAAFWARKNGSWKEVIGTQSEMACSQLKGTGFPTQIVGDECYDSNGNSVPYRP